EGAIVGTQVESVVTAAGDVPPAGPPNAEQGAGEQHAAPPGLAPPRRRRRLEHRRSDPHRDRSALPRFGEQPILPAQTVAIGDEKAADNTQQQSERNPPDRRCAGNTETLELWHRRSLRKPAPRRHAATTTT